MQRKLIIEAFRQPGLLIAAQMLMFFRLPHLRKTHPMFTFSYFETIL